MQSDGTNKIGKKLILCENESYIHWMLGGHHFLTRTELNKILEPQEPILNGTFGELVLN